MQKFLLTFVIIGAINFFVFFCGAVAHGGDALNGKIENGQHYLGSHGSLTPVTKEQYENSKLHAYSVIISWPFVMLCGYIYQKRERAKNQSDNSNQV